MLKRSVTIHHIPFDFIIKIEYIGAPRQKLLWRVVWESRSWLSETETIGVKATLVNNTERFSIKTTADMGS